MNSLRVEHLYKTFTDAGRRIDVLKDVNFSVARGETVAIVGASGAGKSTLLQLLGGLDTPSQGQVFVGEHNISALNERAKGQLRNQMLGFVYQFHHLLPEFNALENVCIPLLIRNMKPGDAREKAEVIIEKVGLKDRLQHRVGELSGGERQRIALARALVTEPQCVLADEPTGNLDADTAEKMTDLMMTLNQALNTSFVIVTHSDVMANRMDRILELRDGQLFY